MSGEPTVVPDVIVRYFSAHDRRATDDALATFASDARVHDDGHDYVGPLEIRDWLDRASTQFTYTRTLVQAAPSDKGTWLIVNHLEGNFPGGEVDLRYQFVLDGEQISELLIAP